LKKSPLPFKRLFAEGVVIVAGVLLALAADGWMEEREERRLEDSYWAELRADLVQADSLLEVAAQFASDRQDGALLVLDAVQGTLSDTVSAKALVYGMSMGNALYIPPVPEDTWNEIVSEGRLHLLRDPPLRRDIAAFYRGVELLREFNQEWLTYVLPYRRAMAPLLPPDVYAASIASSLYPDEVESLEWPDRDELAEALRNDDPVRGSLGDVLNVNLAAQREIDTRRVLLQDLLPRIDAIEGSE
jgi:hypothetical protein